MTVSRRMISIAIALLLLGCGDDSPKSNLRTITMQVGRQTFTLEVADSEPTRKTGLMNRDSMPANRGMLFVFQDEIPRDFWMKNTRIGLDILFINAQGQVVSSKSMKPYDLNTTSSDAPAKYAIELNVGTAATSGVQVGDQLNIPLLASGATDNTAAASQPATSSAK